MIGEVLGEALQDPRKRVQDCFAKPTRDTMLTIRQFIDGKHADPASAEWFDKIDPATGQVVARVPDGDNRDVNAAVRAAVRAFPAWSRTPTAERSRLLLAIADKIDANLEKLALAECVDGG